MIALRLYWLVAQRELLERVRTRSFVLSTSALAVLSAAAIVAADVVPARFGQGAERLAVVSDTPAATVATLRRSADTLGVELDLVGVGDVATGERAVEEGDVDAFLAPSGELVFGSEAYAQIEAVVSQALQTLALPGRLEGLGLTLEQARGLLQPEPVDVRLLDPPDPAEAEDEGGRRALAALTSIALYIVLVLFGNWVLVGVIEEKASRVVEVLLGPLRPAQLLTGKVMGILVSALLQVAVVGVGALAGLVAVGMPDIPAIAAGLAVWSVVWFALGLLFYSFAYAAIGATVSRQADATSAAWPVTMLLIVPYFISLTVLPEDPDGTLARVLSILPLTSPLAMPPRIAVGNPSWLELGASVVLMLFALVGMMALAGRIYAGAILRSRRVGVLDALRSSGETR